MKHDIVVCTLINFQAKFSIYGSGGRRELCEHIPPPPPCNSEGRNFGRNSMSGVTNL